MKACGIKFDENINDLAELLCNYLKICASYLDIRLLIVVGLHMNMNSEALKYVYSTARYEKIAILDIERYRPREKLQFESYYIIDEDYCEISAGNADFS